MIPSPCRSLFKLLPLMPLLCLAFFSLASLAQPELDADSLDALRNEINNTSELAEERRQELLQRLDGAEAELENARAFKARAEQLQQLMENASEQVQLFNQRLQEVKSATDKASNEDLLPPDATVDQVRSQITLVSAERQALSERRTQLLQEIDNLPARRAEIQQRLVALQSQGGTPVSTALDASLEQRVAAAVAAAENRAAVAERQALEVEILSEPASARVNAAERTWLGAAINRTEAKLAALNQALDAARSSATEEQLKTTAQLQQQLQRDDPVLQRFAEENRSLAEQLQSVAHATDSARTEGNQLKATLEGLEQDSLLMQRRLEVAGRKEVLGRVMITRLNSLPETEELRREINQRNALIADTSMEQIDVEEEFRAINDRQDYLGTLLPDLQDWDSASQQLVNDLVDQRRDLLERNLQGMGLLLHQLLENNETTFTLITTTSEFHKFLLGNLLWVRNFSYLELASLKHQLAVLLNPESWTRLPAQLVSGYQALPWSSALLALLLLAILLRRQLRPVYNQMLSKPILISGATLWHMLAGLALSCLLVAPWPLLLFCAGVLLQEGIPASDFGDALAPALKFTAWILYLLLLTRLIASRHGVGRRYLKWNARMLDALRKELNWAGPTICFGVLLDVFVFHLDVVVSGGPLGALATAIVAGSIIAFSVRLLRQEIFCDDSLTRLGLRLTVVTAAAVIVMQAIGLLFAADIYLMALGRSVIALGLIKLAGDVLERWLLILRARLQKQAREEHRAHEQDSEAPDDEEAMIDVISLSEAHTKLLTMVRFLAAAVALFVIWAPSLPALTLLDSMTLWQAGDGAGGLRAITLFDLTLSVVILVVTALVTRNLPSISEVFMREWFNMSAGARYATSILLQYLVIAIGGALFLSTIGWEWSKVQWLVAALGVGIGFGLQEIVANFISGIIILFERPVRVGDVISAGGAEGVVKKINPRATIIETFERKEHLIPNKELITGQVINWTLSENAVRVIVPVGVAYGTDVRNAMALMYEAAGEVELVLPDPEPLVTFEDFGDNALLLWLRCYVSESRPRAWTELRTVINDKFNAAGISISFPQRDVHLDTAAPLQVEVRQLPAGTTD